MRVTDWNWVASRERKQFKELDCLRETSKRSSTFGIPKVESLMRGSRIWIDALSVVGFSEQHGAQHHASEAEESWEEYSSSFSGWMEFELFEWSEWSNKTVCVSHIIYKHDLRKWVTSSESLEPFRSALPSRWVGVQGWLSVWFWVKWSGQFEPQIGSLINLIIFNVLLARTCSLQVLLSKVTLVK